MDSKAVALALVGEMGMLGSLGATMAGEEMPSEELVDLLTTVAHEIRVALENARLYRQRQESLRSYAQQ